jgi:hypothetical protein
MHIVLLLILLLVIEVFAAGIIVRRLQTRHAAVCAELGLPASSDSDLSQQWLAMTRFIYSGACFRLDDVPLNVLCATIVLGEIGIVYALFAAATS